MLHEWAEEAKADELTCTDDVVAMLAAEKLIDTLDADARILL